MGYHVEFSGNVPLSMSEGGSDRRMFIGDAPEMSSPSWNMTYNYDEAFNKAFAGIKPHSSLNGCTTYGGAPLDYGLWLIVGKTVREQIDLLEKAISKLDPSTEDENYWNGSEGNARKVLNQMLQISIWWLAHHPEMADQAEEGVWTRCTW